MSEIATRTPQQELVAQIRADDSQAQIAAALEGSGIPPAKFVRVAITAINENADLVKAERSSLFSALMRCAQDGLLPDGREAALVLFNTKVKVGGQDTWVEKATYMPMIGGFRKIAADHGWALQTAAVFERDEFESQEQPPTLTHKRPRLGTPRGDLVGAYAIATHRDGRRLQEVLDEEEIAKLRSVARTKNVWEKWAPQMYEKSAGRRLFKKLPLDEHDRERVARILDASDFPDAARAIYGPALPPGTGPVTPTAAAPQPPVQAVADEGQQPPGPSPDTANDDEPVLEGEIVDVEAAGAAGAAVVPDGLGPAGQTLADVAENATGEAWLEWALRRPGLFDEEFAAAVDVFVRARFPEMYATVKGEQ